MVPEPARSRKKTPSSMSCPKFSARVILLRCATTSTLADLTMLWAPVCAKRKMNPAKYTAELAEFIMLLRYDVASCEPLTPGNASSQL
eukprot:8757936-Pyramimonas_sp.AAC.1